MNTAVSQMDAAASQKTNAGMPAEFAVYHSKWKIFALSFGMLFLLAIGLAFLAGMLSGGSTGQTTVWTFVGYAFVFVMFFLLPIAAVWKFLSLLKTRRPVLVVNREGIRFEDGDVTPWSNIAKNNFHTQSMSFLPIAKSIALTLHEGKPVGCNVTMTTLSADAYFAACDRYSL